MKLRKASSGRQACPRPGLLILAALVQAGLGVHLAGVRTEAADPPPDLLKPPPSVPEPRARLSPLLEEGPGRAISSPEGWTRRREALEKSWREFLGEFPRSRAPLVTQVLGGEDLPLFRRERLRYQVEEGVWTEAYLLTPREPAGRLPGVVVFHSTVASHAGEPAGLDPARKELALGAALAERGYVVLCPRCFIFDEGADWAGNVSRMWERHPEWKGMARMTWDAVRAADLLASLPRVDPERLGCLGHSLGAKEALYAAAFDRRYRAAVFSEGGIGLRFSNWDAVWYLGVGIWDPESDREHHQLLALIAPRAFLLVAGESADGDRSWPFIEAARPVYRLLEAERSLGWLNHRQGHRLPAEARETALAFLDRHLKK